MSKKKKGLTYQEHFSNTVEHLLEMYEHMAEYYAFEFILPLLEMMYLAKNFDPDASDERKFISKMLDMTHAHTEKFLKDYSVYNDQMAAMEYYAAKRFPEEEGGNISKGMKAAAGAVLQTGDAVTKTLTFPLNKKMQIRLVKNRRIS